MTHKPNPETEFRAQLTTAARTVVEMATGAAPPCPVRFAAAQDVLDRLDIRGAEFIRLVTGRGQADAT